MLKSPSQHSFLFFFFGPLSNVVFLRNLIISVCWVLSLKGNQGFKKINYYFFISIGKNALHLAARNGQSLCVQKLLQVMHFYFNFFICAPGFWWEKRFSIRATPSALKKIAWVLQNLLHIIKSLNHKGQSQVHKGCPFPIMRAERMKLLFS